MQNNREESNDKVTAGPVRTGSKDYFRLILWALGGATVGLLIKKLLDKFLAYTPPIIIKSGSFEIGNKITIGDLNDDHPPHTGDSDLLDPASSYFHYKQGKIEIKCVVVFEHGEPIRCIKFGTNDVPEGRCIIRFYFGGCPPASDESRPDLLVRGKNFRIKSKRELRRVSGSDPRYYFRRTKGEGLCAIIYRRHGNVLTPLETIIFPNDDSITLAIDSDPSEYDVC